MGMSVEQFHEKLEELITPEYLAKAAKYRKFLDDWLESGRPIYTWREEGRKELELKDGEYFVQCFAPDEPGRNELPIFWFYSNYDNLVSVYTDRTPNKEQKLIWLPPKTDGKDQRGVQKWRHPVTGRYKTIKAYTLGSLVLNGGNTFGRAAELLEMFGTYAYGLKDDPWNLQGHHEARISDYPERLYDHEDISTLDVYAHELLRRIRESHQQIRLSDSDSEVAQNSLSIADGIASVTEAEAPGKPVLIWAGERYGLNGTYKDAKGEYAFRPVDPDRIFSREGWLVFADTVDPTIIDGIERQKAAIYQRLKELETRDWPIGYATRIHWLKNESRVCDLIVVRTNHPTGK